jgi:hypothetical protein
MLSWYLIMEVWKGELIQEEMMQLQDSKRK